MIMLNSRANQPCAAPHTTLPVLLLSAGKGEAADFTDVDVGEALEETTTAPRRTKKSPDVYFMGHGSPAVALMPKWLQLLLPFVATKKAAVDR